MADKVRGGIKLRRSSKHKNYYANQFLHTERNKLRRARKRAADKAYWIEQGRKKNGQLVRLLTSQPA